MKFDTNLLQEINVLKMFDLSSSQLGIKVHHDAEPEAVKATQRLFDKGLVTQNDGGYLTGLGRDAAEHTSNLLTILTTA
ncbi:MAG: hypothetical protein ACI84K_001820 [Pseudohongiellaceae bacterium]|jgi:uncharacterized protein (TIGR02647 family)